MPDQLKLILWGWDLGIGIFQKLGDSEVQQSWESLTWKDLGISISLQLFIEQGAHDLELSNLPKINILHVAH